MAVLKEWGSATNLTPPFDPLLSPVLLVAACEAQLLSQGCLALEAVLIPHVLASLALDQGAATASAAPPLAQLVVPQVCVWRSDVIKIRATALFCTAITPPVCHTPLVSSVLF